MPPKRSNLPVTTATGALGSGEPIIRLSAMATHGRIPNRLHEQPGEYVDVQKGYLLVAVLALTSTSTLVFNWISGPHIALTLLLILQLATMVCFCTLFIRIRNGELTWQFGPGWVRGKVALSDISSSHIVTSPLAYGWVLQRSERGWSFRWSGALAVELRCEGGVRVRLGTSRAHELHYFIEKHIERGKQKGRNGAASHTG